MAGSWSTWMVAAVMPLAGIGTVAAADVPPPPPPPVFPTPPPSTATPTPQPTAATIPRPTVRPGTVAPPVVILPPATPTPSPSAQPAVAPATDSGGQVVNRVDTQQTVPVWLIVLLAISAMVNLAWLGLYLYKHYWLPPVEEGHPVAE